MNNMRAFYLLYFLEPNTDNKLAALPCRLFVRELFLAKILMGFKLLGYTINPNHVHLLIYPVGRYNISKIIQYIKRHFTRDYNYIMGLEDKTSSYSAKATFAKQ